MPRLIGKIALTAGGTLLAGALLVVAYVSGGAMVLAFLLAGVFLIGGAGIVSKGLFMPIVITGAVICGLSCWALTALGVGTVWLWMRKSDPPKAGDAP